MRGFEYPAPVQISTNFLRKLILQRYLIGRFVLRDLKSRYVGSLVGFSWSVIHPLVLLVSYTFVFSYIFKVRLQSSSTDNFALFLFCGILPWLYFQDTLLRCCNSIVEHSNLVRKTIFPSEIVPVAYSISNLVTHALGVAILVVILGLLNLISWPLVYLPLYLVPLVVFSLGLGWLTAALQVFLRDTYQILSVLLLLWFWFTPIFYTLEMVPEEFLPLIQLNPLSYVVEGYRLALLEHRMLELEKLFTLILFSLGTFLVGGFVFRSTKREFIDVL